MLLEGLRKIVSHSHIRFSEIKFPLYLTENIVIREGDLGSGCRDYKKTDLGRMKGNFEMGYQTPGEGSMGGGGPHATLG